ncbi:hypothetical protein OIU79_011161 [Salix purpurea]|uniref:K Homology domain-containing protein n=1 Tax=Salix purpurea TaxID=77065 RepID=A0A9Q0QHY8_SALPP|nr:hypothetical protein OIU79_011161 [Salix purpurea]
MGMEILQQSIDEKLNTISRRPLHNGFLLLYFNVTSEIRRASAYNQGFGDHERYEHESPFRSLGQRPNGRSMDLEGWSAMPKEVMQFCGFLPDLDTPGLLAVCVNFVGSIGLGIIESNLTKNAQDVLLPSHSILLVPENGHLQRIASLPAASMGWPGVPGISSTPVVKRVIRLDVPVDKYPNYNFVGRILGPRGNSLKRVEALTECRVYIRGKGSVKDSLKEEKLKDKPGYEHLNEPLHVLVEAEFPEDIMNARLDHAVTILESLLKPVDESFDNYKKQQLRELALLNGTLREESPSMSSPSMSPSMSPFNNAGMKRAKTGR